jgi:hypothetical protein
VILHNFKCVLEWKLTRSGRRIRAPQRLCNRGILQSQEQKNRIFIEARRLLVAGGQYGIHELCLLPDDISDSLRHEIQAAMSKEIHVGVQPLCRSEWVRLFEQNGLKATWKRDAPMRLLEPRRMLQDEGFKGVFRIAASMAMNPTLRERIFAMRQLFRKYRDHLGAIALIGLRAPENV